MSLPPLLPLELTAHGFSPARKSRASTSTSFSLPRTPWVAPPPASPSSRPSSPLLPSTLAASKTIALRQNRLDVSVPPRSTSLPTKRIITAVIRSHRRPFSANANANHRPPHRPKSTVRPFSAPNPIFIPSTTPTHFMGAIITAAGSKRATHRSQGTMTTTPTPSRSPLPLPMPPMALTERPQRPTVSKTIGTEPLPLPKTPDNDSPVDPLRPSASAETRRELNGGESIDPEDDEVDQGDEAPRKPRTPDLYDCVSSSTFFIVDKTMSGQGLPNLKFVIDDGGSARGRGQAVYCWREIIEAACPALIDAINDEGILYLDADLNNAVPPATRRPHPSARPNSISYPAHTTAASMTSARMARTQSVADARSAALEDIALDVEREAATQRSNSPTQRMRQRLLSLRKPSSSSERASRGSNNNEVSNSSSSNARSSAPSSHPQAYAPTTRRMSSAWWDQLAHQPIVGPSPPPRKASKQSSKTNDNDDAAAAATSIGLNEGSAAAAAAARKRSVSSSLNSLRPKTLLGGSGGGGEGRRKSKLSMSMSLSMDARSVASSSRRLRNRKSKGDEDAEEEDVIPEHDVTDGGRNTPQVERNVVHGELVRVRGCDIDTLRALVFYLCTNQVHFATSPSASPTPSLPTPPILPVIAYTLSTHLSLPHLLSLSRHTLLSTLTPSTILPLLLSPFAQRFPSLRAEMLCYARRHWGEVKQSEGGKEVWGMLVRGELSGSGCEVALAELVGGLEVGET